MNMPDFVGCVWNPARRPLTLWGMTAISATLPAVAKPPCDEFGKHLTHLRQERRISARALALALGQNESYIYQWEHKPIHASREVLQRVVQTLELDESERRELFRLADLRDAPQAAKDLYQPAIDSDANLLAALLRIPHEWPTQSQAPSAQSQRVKPLLEAAGWALARAAADDPGVMPPASIDWPAPLVQRGVVQALEPSFTPVVPHPGLLHEELSHRDIPLEQIAQKFDDLSLALGVARTYRRLLFADAGRAHASAGLLKSWAYERVPGVPESITLVFQDRVTCCVDIVDVRCNAVASVEMVLLTHRLWPQGDRAPAGRWKYSWTTPARDAFRTIATANPELFEYYEDGQDIRDAIYALRSGYVDYDAACKELGLERGGEQELTKALRTGRLDTQTAQQLALAPYRLAAVKDPRVLVAYLRSLEALVPSLDEGTAEPSEKVKAKRKRRL